MSVRSAADDVRVRQSEIERPRALLVLRGDLMDFSVLDFVSASPAVFSSFDVTAVVKQIFRSSELKKEKRKKK